LADNHQKRQDKDEAGHPFSLIDSHAHLDMEEFDPDRDQVLKRALQAGITQIITIGVDLRSSQKAITLTEKHPFLSASVGCHPHNAEACDHEMLEELKRLTFHSRVVAWGEIGLDFFRNYAPRAKQKELFRLQLEMALEVDLPVIIHDRKAHQEVLDILDKTKNQRGVIHCFSGDYELAMTFIDMGFYISIPGTVTYKKAKQVQDVATRIPLEALLLETDAPYLAPHPKRGRRNEPLYMTYTAKKIAQLRGLDLQTLAHQTSENTIKLFSLPSIPISEQRNKALHSGQRGLS
jgi:TatD DNase family protein